MTRKRRTTHACLGRVPTLQSASGGAQTLCCVSRRMCRGDCVAAECGQCVCCSRADGVPAAVARSGVMRSALVTGQWVTSVRGVQEAAINAALGEAQSIMRRSEATATGVKLIAQAITTAGGRDAVSMHLAQQYVDAFGNIARTGNTMIVPADAGNVASMVATAAGVFRGTSGATGGGVAAGGNGDGGDGGEKAEAEKGAEVKAPLGGKMFDDKLAGLATGMGAGEAGVLRHDVAEAGGGAAVDEAFLRTWVQGQGAAPHHGPHGGFSLSK